MRLNKNNLGIVQRVTRRDSAREQIMAAVRSYRSSEYACAITLALAAEDHLPSTDEPHLFGKVLQLTVGKALSNLPSTAGAEARSVARREAEKEIADHLNLTRNWLKHNKAPDEWALIEFEVFIALTRAITKFQAVYPDENDAAMEEFVTQAQREIGLLWPPKADVGPTRMD